MEHALAGEKDCKAVKEMYDSIAKISIIERICYNYQFHELTPLAGCDSLDRITFTRQYEEVLEVKNYDKFKTIVEVCKASGIKFSLMCTSNVDMAIKMLSNTGKMITKQTFKDGVYFKLDPNDRKLVDN